MPADLHIHTFFSDGTQSPEEIVELAKKGGLTTIAITDHDVVAGIERAKKKGAELGVAVIPGIELTTEAFDSEIHILGYFIDTQSAELLEIISKIQKSREDRIFTICEKLQALGVKLDPDKVFAIAGHRAAGRPHVARALIAEGYVKNFKEAFVRYLDFHGPAYVSHYKLSPAEAIKLVLAADGLPVFGHPAVSACDQCIPELMSTGLVGLEVYYGAHNQGQTQHYLELAEKYGLLLTGGSDYHGSTSGREIKLGDFSIADDLVEKLKNEHLRRNKS
ncbi:MAG: PHP domain-containing protein [Candidatus Margulisbacteria bacterium]|nr:PHP domain-containing protein [Candidatus Margulisiibacteriota bacterium]